jgi:cysteinyl-tRNA synthetase
LVLLGGCSKIRTPAATIRSLDDTKFWAYQIQGQTEGDSIKELADSHYDLLVIDQTRSIEGETDYDSRADVARLKKSGNSSGGRKIVICYLDVGQAESYRWYWKKGWEVGKPEWIVAPDPDGWDDNYPVKFWRKEWRDIIKRYLDRVIADGYDGVYLDWLEVYSFGPVAREAEKEGLDAQEELIRFVREISRHARSQRPDFIFIAQNAAEMGEHQQYVELFDGIAQEAIWYDGSGDPDVAGNYGDFGVDPDESEECLRNLKLWQKRGKIVFNVEYAKESSKVKRVYRLGRASGFKTYVTIRALDGLTTDPPPGY